LYQLVLALRAAEFFAFAGIRCCLVVGGPAGSSHCSGPSGKCKCQWRNT